MLRFGLDDGHPLTLEEVGQKFGVTRERIRQIEAKTLAKLKAYREAQRLQDFLDWDLRWRVHLQGDFFGSSRDLQAQDRPRGPGAGGVRP